MKASCFAFDSQTSNTMKPSGVVPPAWLISPSGQGPVPPAASMPSFSFTASYSALPTFVSNSSKIP